MVFNVAVRKIVTILLFVFFFTSFFNKLVFAEAEVIPAIQREQINPDAGNRYLVKRFKEKVILFFKFSPDSKVDYYQTLLDKRLAELVYIADNKNIAFIETTSSRYESTAGQLTEMLVKLDNKDKFSATEKKFGEHLLILDQAQRNFMQPSAEWRFVQNDINSVKIYSQQIPAH